MIVDFLMEFSDVLPTWPDVDGKDQIDWASRLHSVPITGIQTNIVRVSAPEAVIQAMQESGQFPRWFAVEEASDGA